ncbi:DNA polymerase III subunit epsilon [Porphyromonas macacae]|uniref:DNA polymerase III subunit epsilon n=1 Tax=Porphyromonas macacae TaxID=28115 RepID=A0A0A2EA14_9PORP|nr:3'-5' exonuclease [Porphyromonas macacae]KGN74477.1 DNA polymerase III subunit epsilon [Porphyromonas macacae]
MNIKLNKPIVFFDLETTGVRVAEDRIIEISIVKLLPDGSREVKTRRINPECHIPEETTAIHGITDEDVKDYPTFKQVAKSLYQFIRGCDLAGFNSNRFDLPLLVEEFLRAGVDVDFSNANQIDVQTIYHKMEPRTLSAAYKYYCDKEHVEAHSAEADTLATMEIFLAQLERYPDLPHDMKQLDEISRYHNTIDFAGCLVRNEQGEPVVNFGKYKGKSLMQIFETDPSYYSWVLNAQFTQDTKRYFTKYFLEYNQRKKG